MRHRSLYAFAGLLGLLCLFLVVPSVGCSNNVKEPAVAGSFYPAAENDLKVMVNVFLTRAETVPAPGRLISLIAPHAGYQFSGQVAAYTYKQLADRDVRTVILIGPSHRKAFQGASVYTAGYFKTPLGRIRINEKAARMLINESAHVRFDAGAFQEEHSLEVQLPFLQQTLQDFTIVPILIGSLTRESFQHLSAKLADLLDRDEKTILIASTDLSHYHNNETALAKDAKVISAIERMSVEELQQLIMTGEGELCGAAPVILTMNISRSLGATNGILYRYANSGDITSDRSSVVGYAAMGLYKSGLAREERARLLSLAKDAIAGYVRNGKPPEVSVTEKRLAANGATFVSIYKNGDLRGCIGNIAPVMPLYQSVIQNAVSACSRDPRFLPMNKDELGDITVEVSVLSPFEPVKEIDAIEIGRHGLYIMLGQQSGLLLPQVAEKFRWDRTTFLEQVSLKAGLPKDSWKTARLYKFTADIIR